MIYLTLGDVTFQDFEVPEQISFGGRQQVAVHELIGGGRVVDVLGGQPAEIEFAGIFSGSDAVTRAQSLDRACAAGAVLGLGWDAFYYNVVIAAFAADYRKPGWIPFRITCLAISDIARATVNVQPIAASLISADLAIASQWSGAAGMGVQTYNAANAVSAQSACANAVSAAGGGLLTNVSVINNPAAPFAAITALSAVSQNAETLAVASYAGGYLARAVQNIALEAA